MRALIRRLLPKPAAGPALPVSISIEAAGRSWDIHLKRNPRAKRLTLRHDTAADRFLMVVPPRVPLSHIRSFAERTAGWMVERARRIAPRIAFADGVEIPILGGRYHIRHRPGPGTPARLSEDPPELVVTGDPAHLARRVGDFLKARAKAELTRRSREMCARIGQPPARVTLRDPRTRWGSCSAAGGLSFSWRLILAPETVLDYVVAHEVAHLIEMNHGPRFWRLADELARDSEGAQAWLKQHGASLHRYG